MFRKISSAVTSLAGTPATLPTDHYAPARAQTYVKLAKNLAEHGVATSFDDCATCDVPCPPGTANGHEGGATIVDGSTGEKPWGGKPYLEYVEETYGDLGNLPNGFDMDWESDLAGSSKGGTGRIAVISTGKSDWERNHADDKKLLAYHLSHVLEQQTVHKGPKSDLAYVTPSAFPPPSQVPARPPPSTSMYSSSLISQSDDPEDQSVLVFPDWKVVHEVENSPAGAKGLWQGALDGKLGRAGARVSEGSSDVDRRRSWVLPYRAVVLLCSHKRRDKRCHIAAPLLRSALHTVLAKHDINVDDTGASLTHLDGPPLEEVAGSDEQREAEVARRMNKIEGAQGGEGGEVGIFNINHLGGHRYAGVMIILFPSGAYLSYGRVMPKDIPRVVEETILQGKVVPGLLRNAVGVEDRGKHGFLSW